MKLITAFENYVTSVYPVSELDRTISEDGRIVSYALTCRSNEHQFINIKQVDDDYIRFEMYFEKYQVQSDYFFTSETPETQMKIIKRLFDNTLSDYKRDIWDIYEITKKIKKWECKKNKSECCKDILSCLRAIAKRENIKLNPGWWGEKFMKYIDINKSNSPKIFLLIV